MLPLSVLAYGLLKMKLGFEGSDRMRMRGYEVGVQTEGEASRSARTKKTTRPVEKARLSDDQEQHHLLPHVHSRSRP
jgi:hypothetical protein